MERLTSNHLGPFESVAVIANDAIGNFVVATPLLQKIHQVWSPRQLTYFGGARTELFQSHSSEIQRSIHLFGIQPEVALTECKKLKGSFEVVINLENSPIAKRAAQILACKDTFVAGHLFKDDGNEDFEPPIGELGDFLRFTDWTAPGLMDRYACLNSSFIGEIFVRMCGLKGPVPHYKLPSLPGTVPVPPALISTSASLSCKLWPTSKWIEIAVWLNELGIRPGIVGAAKSARASWQGWDGEDELVRLGLAEDLRGRLNLLESVWALSQAKIAITIDNGVGHMSAASSCPSVVLYREGIHRLWHPPYETASAVITKAGEPVASVSVEAVQKAVLEQLGVLAYA